MLSTFDVIAEPSRRRILDLLRVEERSVGELVEHLSLSQPAVSKHLRVLRQARLVRAQVSAQRRVYQLDAAPLLEVEAWLEPYRRFWSDRLDALGRHLDRHAELARRGEAPSAAPTARGRRAKAKGPERAPSARRTTPRRKQ